VKKQKILHIITLSEVGGAQRIVEFLAKGLDKNTYDVTVACSPDGELVSWLREDPDIKIVELPQLVREINLYWDLKALTAIISLIRREKFAIVHCHSSKVGILGRIAARFCGVPSVMFTVHGWGFDHYPIDSPKYKVFVWIEKQMQKITDKVICVSRLVAEKGYAYKILQPEKTAVILNGVQIKPLISNKLRAELGIEGEATIIGTVCRLAPPKLPLLFIQIAAMLLAAVKEKPIKFVIIGDGPYYEQCNNLIKELSLKDRLFLLGNRTDVPELVANFDIFTLFSESEGLPVVILEAMAASKPVVASNVGGIPELVNDGQNGFLINNEDKTAIVEKLLLLIEDSQLNKEMSQNSLEKVRRFSLENMIKAYEDIYRNSLKS
jgi:glycosyltransferase involved in cell wall biosynthesis